MILKFKFKEDKEFVFVHAECNTLKIEECFIFNYDKFFKRYNHEKFDYDMLKDDIADTILNIMSLPYTKEEIINDMSVSINSDIFKMIELK
jgi:hypothetical protein